MAAYETAQDAPTLPLFCYTAAGWKNDVFYVTARRIERDIRQDAPGFDDAKVKSGQSLLRGIPTQQTGEAPGRNLRPYLPLPCSKTTASTW